MYRAWIRYFTWINIRNQVLKFKAYKKLASEKTNSLLSAPPSIYYTSKPESMII